MLRLGMYQPKPLFYKALFSGVFVFFHKYGLMILLISSVI